MVCIYCSGNTKVVNSRQNASNKIWRRRNCLECSQTFTTFEFPDLYGSLVVTKKDGSTTTLSREQLLIDIYESMKHHKTATQDAAAITDNILGRLLKTVRSGAIELDILNKTSLDVLRKFDKASAVLYEAYHTTS